ncbi:MAG: acetyl-CoA carboxylase biotin carboxylase subunit [Actinomycetota bacterium]|nr:acetyl-CoA carboxylase biotin carboxylase subunit [Actinomycetota bacterium]
MFTKLLIANRGEIAVRVIRACRDLGITSVAVYSELDADALHVELADEAYNIGPGPASLSYLDIPSIIEAAKRSGAQAVHPGYGFLAENAAFAQAVTDAGMAWVGPEASVIASMGDKTSARRAAAEAGVDSVPGTLEPVTEAAEVQAFCDRHGLPVAIKAAAGGGGKGFRVVRSAADIPEALAGAAREAKAYFSSADVYIERYLERPRHIEVQVLGDASGAILSFPERDCSLQRRHQKLLEESPSPALEEDVREAIMEAAAKVSKRVGYRNAGTCEFLLDRDGTSFYFLEMNTRLQVEHPVTELVCGVDLVTAQILIAAGEPLGFDQGDLALSGHAIECRINAEDPALNFLPAPGVISTYREPGGPGVRVDSGARAGTVVPGAYDPLIAKLIVHGSTRSQAIGRLSRAADEFRIEGIRTTLEWHRRALADERFLTGTYDTATVEHDMPLGTPNLLEASGGEPDGDSAVRRFGIEIDGKRFEIVARERSSAAPGLSKPARPQTGGHVGAHASDVLKAPMQGTIIKLLVATGDEVRAGEAVCVLEAMKMENSILTHRDGIVGELKVAEGQSVEPGAVLAVIT